MKPNRATHSMKAGEAGYGRMTGKFTAKVATPEQVRKANVVLTRIVEEVKETGWKPYRVES